jgi:hypothetical protein
VSSDVGPVLRILYRHYGGDNTKPRPAYYSKLLALTSMLRAAEALPRAPEIVYINDQVGPGPILSLMERTGEVVPVRGGSDSRSYRAMLTREAARSGPADQLLWFSEDDYLYRPDALVHLTAGAARLPEADYLTMLGSRALDVQASTGRRVISRPEPGAGGDPEAREIDDVRWYRAVSSTSTFGTRLRTLQQDLQVLRLCALSGGSWDHTTKLTLGGFRTFRAGQLAADLLPFRSAPPAAWPKSVARGAVRLAVTARAHRRPSQRRRLFAADPELILHMEVDLPGSRPAPSARTAATDWAAIARDTVAWGEARGIAAGQAVAS